MQHKNFPSQNSGIVQYFMKTKEERNSCLSVSRNQNVHKPFFQKRLHLQDHLMLSYSLLRLLLEFMQKSETGLIMGAPFCWTNCNFKKRSSICSIQPPIMYACQSAGTQQQEGAGLSATDLQALMIQPVEGPPKPYCTWHCSVWFLWLATDEPNSY